MYILLVTVIPLVSNRTEQCLCRLDAITRRTQTPNIDKLGRFDSPEVLVGMSGLFIHFKLMTEGRFWLVLRCYPSFFLHFLLSSLV